jgi:membrane complex biogenesis BtpA family protein
LEDDAEASISVAQAAGADFVRLKVFVGAMAGPDGIRQGNAYCAQKYRATISAKNIALVTDVYDRTRWPLDGDHFEAMVHEAVWYGKSNALVITGRSRDETLSLLERARRVAKVPLWVGGGVDVDNINDYLNKADGVIVATSLKKGKDVLQPIEREQVRALVEAIGHGQITTASS